MNIDECRLYLIQAKSSFEKLQSIAYKDININGTGIKVLGIHYMDCDDKWVIKKHRHSFFEFHYVYKDYVYTCINSKENKITEGQFYIMPPGTYHSHRQDAGTGHMGFALRWEFNNSENSNKMERYSHQLLNSCKLLLNAHSNPIADSGKLISKMAEILEEVSNGASTLYLQLEFCQLLDLISSFYKNKLTEVVDSVNVDYLENNIIRNAIEFMEENCCQDIDVNEISSCVHLSYSHLARLFKKHTGETINRHLNKIRLVRAQRLLVNTDKTIAQIANLVGYNNNHYFCSIFKSFYGITPGEFRNSGNLLNE